MTDVFSDPLLAITLTLGSYLFGSWVYRHSKNFPLFHPIVIAAATVTGILLITGTSYTQYRDSTKILNLMLGTATVALAVPLYQQWHLIKSHARPILITLFAGAVFAPLIAVGLAWSLGATPEILLSLVSKSVTTPIAIAVAESLGGITTVAAGTVIAVGIVGAMIGPVLLNNMGIHNAIVRGFTLGLTAHAVGTARAFEEDPVSGSFASLGLALTGALTALAAPVVWHLVTRFI